MASPTTKTLPVDELVLDGGTQSRVAISEETVEEYVEVLAKHDGEWPFPDLDVFHDGNQYLVGDGFHRTLAARRHGRDTIPCRVHQGTAWDALRFGMIRNLRNGLRPNQADKRRNVELLLDSGKKLTQKEIADLAGVSDRTVRNIIAERKGKNADISADDPFIDDDDPFATAGNGDDSGGQELPPPPSKESDDTGGAGDEPPKEKTPAELFRIQRAKTKKTAESLSRAISDLNDLRKKQNKCTALKQRVYDIIEEIEDW